MDALLKAPDRQTAQGHRDYALLLFLYNTGARADDTAQLTIADLCLAHAPEASASSAWLRGKGSKRRRRPLWPDTVAGPAARVHGRQPMEHVVLNRPRQHLTRF